MDAAQNLKLDSMPQIIRKIPRSCLEPDTEKSFGYFYRNIVLMAISIGLVVWADTWWAGIPLAFLIGTLLTSFFIVGHDCGHRSFSKSERICNIVGHLSTSWTFWPFHVWRLSHDNHHRNTHNLSKEIAWRPMTVEQFEKASPMTKFLYKASRTWLMPIASFIFTFFWFKMALNGRRSKFFDKKDLPQVRWSVFVTIVLQAFYAWGSYALAGWYGVVCIFLLPQAGFQYWLSIYTYFHHTIPDRQIFREEDWSMEKGQLHGSIHVDHPGWVEWFHHDINWHVPHHVCVGIPHYHLRAAHRALKAAYPDVVLEKKFGWKLFSETLKTCHLIRDKDAGGQGWVTFAAAEKLARQNRKTEPSKSETIAAH